MKKQNNLCRISGKKLTNIIDFGNQPLGNGFLKRKDFNKEYFYKMRAGFCKTSKMFQLIEQPNPKKIFHNNYAFFSGTSKNMQEHFKKLFEKIINFKLIKNINPFIVEIGCNDGILLKHFAKKNIKHLGIEPSKNVARKSMLNGVKTMNNFFSYKLSNKILKQYGKANIICAANVICHIPNLLDLAKGIKNLLTKDGLFIFEEPYLGDVIKKTSYDQFYDEHVYLFSLHSIKYLFNKFNLEIIKVEHLNTHGGSMRYFISHSGSHSKSKIVDKTLKKEIKEGVNNISSLIKFRNNVLLSKDNLRKLLIKLKKEGKKICGYAATSKSTTIINYCDLGTELIDYICDTTPIKQNKFSPGKHIPIKSDKFFRKKYPDYAILFAWNHSKEIMAKEKDFIRKGGKWIIFIPRVKIISK